MSKAARLLLLGAFALAILISLFVYRRIDAPAGGAWWSGKHPVVRLQVWEPGKDMPTVSMTLPKSTLDRMVALGISSDLRIDGGRPIDFKSFWHDLQRLPRGEKMRFTEDDATVLIWLEERGKGGAGADSGAATAAP